VPNPTYDLISSTTLTSATTSVTFSTIPTTYKDLRLVAAMVKDTTTNSSRANYIYFNSDTTGSNYPCTRMYSSYGTITGDRQASNAFFGGWATDGPFEKSDTIMACDIFDYNNSSVRKSHLVRVTDPSGRYFGFIGGFWSSTNAITSIEYRTASNMPIGTVISLYGIATA
jgi:hypothetical protein